MAKRKAKASDSTESAPYRSAEDAEVQSDSDRAENGDQIPMNPNNPGEGETVGDFGTPRPVSGDEEPVGQVNPEETA